MKANKNTVQEAQSPLRTGVSSNAEVSLPQATKMIAQDAFAAAEVLIRNGVKLDMAALARTLHIGRATLYRWTGDREELIKTVLASYLVETLQRIDTSLAQQRISGVERIARTVEDMMRILAKSNAVKALLLNEPAVALRILTVSGADSLQGTTIFMLKTMIEREMADRQYQPRLAPELFAYTLVRLVDSFVYGDIIAGIEVDLDTANKIIRSLM